MRHCCKCGEWKDESQFYYNPRSRSKLDYKCGECAKLKVHRYRQTEAGKEQVWRYNNSEKGHTCIAKYNQGEQGKQVNRARSYRRHYQFPERNRALGRVHHAIKVGKLPKPSELECAYQGKHCKGKACHYHHWSYEPQHALDVKPLCAACHKEVHLNGITLC